MVEQTELKRQEVERALQELSGERETERQSNQEVIEQLQAVVEQMQGEFEKVSLGGCLGLD